MAVRLRPDHCFLSFLRRTISAQLHLVGSLLVLLGGAYLLPLAKIAGPSHYWACLTFVASGFCVFISSALVHFLGDGFDADPRTQLLFENLDHFCIYLFIAGTYTPFVISAISVPWQFPLLVTIWTVAFLGILYTLFKPALPQPLQSRAVYTGLFVLMGWTLIIRINEVLFDLSWLRLGLLVLGGLAYSIGAVVYATKRPRLLEGFFGYHELWHVMVLAGAMFHYLLIFSFYSPLGQGSS